MKRLVRLLLEHPFVLVPPAFYLYTMCPTIGFGDTAIMIDAMRRGLVDSQVNTHPMTVLMGMLFQEILPFKEFAIRANLVSVFFGSLTIIAFYGVVMYRHRSRLVAATASVFMMLCQSMWWHATIVENYATSALFVVVCLYLWERFASSENVKDLYWLCFTAGLGIFNHVQLGFLCVGVAVTGIVFAWPRGKEGIRIVLNCFLSAVVGLTPWMLIVANDWRKSGDFSGTVKNAFVGSFSDTFFSGAFWPSIRDTLYLFVWQSPTPYLACGLIGWWLMLQRDRLKHPVTLGMITCFTLNTVNFCFYPTWDKYAFLLESFIIFHFFAAEGFHWVIDRVSARPELRNAVLGVTALSAAFPPFFYSHVATWALSPDSFFYQRWNNNYSDNLYFQSEYIVNPNKRNFREVEEFANLLFEKLPKDALFLDDDSRSYYCLADYFQRYYNKRPDISTLLVNSWGIKNWGLGGDSLADIMARAYFLNKPFFVASLQSPFNGFIEQAKRHAPIEFEKFPLSRDKWIYRMITQARATASTDDGWQQLEKLGAFQPLKITAAQGFLDVGLKNILFFSIGEPRQQNMHGFPGSWQGDDQIFFASDKAGAALEFGIKTEKELVVALTANLTTAPDYGLISIELPDGQKQETDLYSEIVQRTQVSIPQVALKPGLNRVRFTIVDKNRRSAGYKMGIDGFAYRLTAKK